MPWMESVRVWGDTRKAAKQASEAPVRMPATHCSGGARLGERPTSARARCSECFVEVWRVEMDCGLRAERPGVDV